MCFAGSGGAGKASSDSPPFLPEGRAGAEHRSILTPARVQAVGQAGSLASLVKTRASLWTSVSPPVPLLFPPLLPVGQLALGGWLSHADYLFSGNIQIPRGWPYPGMSPCPWPQLMDPRSPVTPTRPIRCACLGIQRWQEETHSPPGALQRKGPGHPTT